MKDFLEIKTVDAEQYVLFYSKEGEYVKAQKLRGYGKIKVGSGKHETIAWMPLVQGSPETGLEAAWDHVERRKHLLDYDLSSDLQSTEYPNIEDLLYKVEQE